MDVMGDMMGVEGRAAVVVTVDSAEGVEGEDGEIVPGFLALQKPRPYFKLKVLTIGTVDPVLGELESTVVDDATADRGRPEWDEGFLFESVDRECGGSAASLPRPTSNDPPPRSTNERDSS